MEITSLLTALFLLPRKMPLLIRTVVPMPGKGMMVIALP